MLLSQSGDTEINPSPINFCHWNHNGIAANDFVKVTLIETFIKTIRNIFRFTNPTHWWKPKRRHTKRGGVCIYYKEYLVLTRKIGILKLNECIITEITVNNERCFLTSLYRSPSKTQKQLKNEK